MEFLGVACKSDGLHLFQTYDKAKVTWPFRNYGHFSYQVCLWLWENMHFLGIVCFTSRTFFSVKFFSFWLIFFGGAFPFSFVMNFR